MTKNVRASQVITAILRPRPGKQAEFLQMLEGLRHAISGADGCAECVVAQDVADHSRYVLLSMWSDIRALEAHLQSVHFGILRGAADVLGTQTELRLFTSVREEICP